MISINLWSKASQLGSKIKDSLQLSTEDKPLVEKEIYDKLKEDYEQLKKDFEDKTEKYNKIINEINNKNQKEENLSENEYKKNLDQIIDKFKNYLIKLFEGNDTEDIKDKINLIFINPFGEDFDKKIDEFNKKKFENILMQKFSLENKEIISDLLKNERENNLESNINMKEINTFQKFKDLLEKLEKDKKSALSYIKSLNNKLNDNDQQMKIMQETIKKMQKDYNDLKNEDSIIKESIIKKEKEFAEKELKYNEIKNILEKNDNEMKEKEIKINSYITQTEQLNMKIIEQKKQININENQINKYEEEIKNLNIKIKTYKENLDLLQVNSDEINTKNIQITELLNTVESLKSSYKLLKKMKK